jgi:hypothetical protein
MRTATATLKSASPYSQSKEYASEIPKLNGETPEAYDIRTWREHCHTTPEGNIFISPMAFKFALAAGAKMLGIKIPSKRGATMTKYFDSGVLVMEPLVLPDKKDAVPFDKIYAHANGKRGSGTRVWRRFPRIDHWTGKVAFHVLADEITPEAFEEALRQAGAFIGIGRFRPESPIGGFYGRFEVASISWM